MKDSKLAYLSAAIIFHSSGTRLNRRWVMVAYLRSCIYNKIINLHLLLSEEPKHTGYTDTYPENTHTLSEAIGLLFPSLCWWSATN